MDTFEIRTPKQVTLFFRSPDGELPVSRRIEIAEGISIRHSGGYAELPAKAEGSSGQYTYRNLLCQSRMLLHGC